MQYAIEQDKITEEWWITWQGKRVTKMPTKVAAEAKLKELKD